MSSLSRHLFLSSRPPSFVMSSLSRHLFLSSRACRGISRQARDDSAARIVLMRQPIKTILRGPVSPFPRDGDSRDVGGLGVINHCVTNTRQLPSFSPRSTYFFSISLSSSFCMAAMLMPVSSIISASVSVGSVRMAFRIFV